MAQEDSRYPELRVPTLGGLNERPSPANLRPGEFDVLEGLYPANIGLLRRIPGKTLLATLSGKVLQIYPTYNVHGDVLIQTTTGLYAYALDELRNRAVAPNLTFEPIPEEETMSMAILVQREASGVSGGTINGIVSSPGGASANTWYPRRLTNKLSDPDSFVTFTAAGSGSGAASFGTFQLPTGSYRISVVAAFCLQLNNASTQIGLWNATSGTFEVYDGGSDPIMGGSATSPTSSDGTQLVAMEGSFTVSSTAKTYHIRQQCSNSTSANAVTLGGVATAGTATVNGSAPTTTFCFVKILKTA